MFDFDLLEEPAPDPATASCSREAGLWSMLIPPRKPSASTRKTELVVEVATLRGDVTVLRMPGGCTVEQVKQELERLKGVSVAEQQLVLGTELLDASRTLGEGPLRLTMVQVRGARRVTLSGCRSGSLFIWDLDCGSSVRELAGSAPITCVAMAWAARRAVAGSGDCALHLFDLERGSLVGKLRGHTGGVSCLAVDWGLQRAVSGSEDGTLRVWDMDCRSTIQELRGHVNSVLCVAADFAVERAVSGGEDRMLRVWDLESGEALLELPGHHMPVNCVVAKFDAKPNALGISGSFAIVRLWSLSRVPFHWDFTSHTSGVTCVSVHWESLTVLSGCTDSTLLCGRLVMNANKIDRKRVLRGHSQPVTCLAADWVRRRAASGSEDGTVRFWDLRRGVSLQELRGHVDGVLCAALELQDFGCEGGEAAEDPELLQRRQECGIAEAVGVDLARGCLARASSEKSTERAAGLAVDGDPGTRWTSNYSDNQWLAVDLGQACRLSHVEINWEAAYAAGYALHGSMDGTDWRTMATEVGREGWVVTRMPTGCQARWIRMYGQRRATKFGFSIWELRVYEAVS